MALRWISVDRINSVLDANEFAKLVNDDSTTTIASGATSNAYRCCEDAEDEVAGAAGMRYTLSDDSGTARRLALVLAVRNLYDRKGGVIPDAWRVKVARAERDLDYMIDGKLAIEGMIRTTAKSAVVRNRAPGNYTNDTDIDF